MILAGNSAKSDLTNGPCIPTISDDDSGAAPGETNWGSVSSTSSRESVLGGFDPPFRQGKDMGSNESLAGGTDAGWGRERCSPQYPQTTWPACRGENKSNQ